MLLVCGDLIGMPPRVQRRLIESFRLRIDSLSEHSVPSCVLPISVVPLLGEDEARNQVTYKGSGLARRAHPAQSRGGSEDLKG